MADPTTIASWAGVCIILGVTVAIGIGLILWIARMISGLFITPQEFKPREKMDVGPKQLPDLELGDVQLSDVVDNKTHPTDKPVAPPLKKWKSGSGSTLGKDETRVSAEGYETSRETPAPQEGSTPIEPVVHQKVGVEPPHAV